MNPFEDLEATLRGFRPRTPSAKVKASALARPESVGPAGTPFPFWMAPATAAAMLMLTLATAWMPGIPGSGDSYALAAVNDPAGISGSGIQHNAPPSPRFRSTNAGPMAPRFGFLLLRQTNVFAP